MKRQCVLVGVLMITLGMSLAHGQNINNVGMPWEAVRAATRGSFEGLPVTAQKTEPFKIFDNIYYVGLETIGSYLVQTSDGLILLDATHAETAEFVLDGVRTLGFNPANIKHIIITHGHGDHVAGAGRIKQVTNAPIHMAAADWDAVAQLQSGPQAAQNGIKLAREVIINDGDTLKLGDTTLKFYVAPGHTQGNVITEIQAKGNGRTFRTLLGVAFAPAPGFTAASIKTTERLKSLGPWDALLPSHSYLAPVAIPMTARQILAGEPLPKNPTGHQAAVGAARINAYFDQILVAVRDRLAKEQAPGATTR